MHPAQKYRGRFAPSPTGPLHLGSLCTALAGFVQAKSLGGEWLLRLDDADTPRVAPGAGDGIQRTLERFALHWDGQVVLQSQEAPAYQAALEQLDAAGLLYACTCSRKTLAALPRPSADAAIYHGLCRNASNGRNRAHALRVIVADAVIQFDDKQQGPQRWDLACEFGDFIVFRRDGFVAYHLATVVDDARAGVTEVLRGHDLLASTPLQIHLQQLLGLPTPDYRHVPVIVNREGAKLSKQNLADAVDARDPSATLFTLLELLGQAPPAELCKAPPEAILTWAVAHWEVSRLAGVERVEPRRV
jgi:glutamyl-Q tRNA(Asp) synthetase